jgi:hypothetical protein
MPTVAMWTWMMMMIVDKMTAEDLVMSDMALALAEGGG